MHNAHLHTEDRALRSGKNTFKIKCTQLVLALDIQSLMNTTLVLMRKIKKLYKGGLEPGTLEPHTFLKKVLPLDYHRSKVNNSNVFIYSML